MKTCALSMSLLLTTLLVACGGGSNSPPGNEPAGPHDVSTAHPPTLDGAREVLKELSAWDADVVKLRSQLKPTKEDLDKIYQPGYVEKAVKAEDKLWSAMQRDLALRREPGQTELLVFGATTRELRAWQPPASEQFADDARTTFRFARVPLYVLDDLKFFRFKFVKPGEKYGAAFSALLTHVNGRWVLIWNPAWVIDFYDDIMKAK